MSPRPLPFALVSGLALGLALAAPAAWSEDASAASNDQERAQLALNAVRTALSQVEAEPEVQKARAHLADAERLYAKGRFAEAAARADEAWKLLAAAGASGTRFSVEVDDAGATKVTSRAGQPVRVEARGVERQVEPGEVVAIRKGDPPPEPQRPPSPPALSLPADGALLKLRPDKDGKLGPVKLTWKRISGARGYTVELAPEGDATAEPVVLQAPTNELKLPPLPAGRYRWTVKARGDASLLSAASEARAFQLEADTLKLDVRGTGWK